MTWVAWRQQRLTIAVLLTLVAAATAAMVALRYDATRFITEHALAACWNSSGGTCQQSALDAFGQRYNQFMALYPWVLLCVPPLVGMFLGAPLFAREFERRSYVFGLTQSVGRIRWWATKILVAILPGGLAVLAFGVVMSWALTPLRHLSTARILAPRFETEGLTLGAYTLLAFCLGVVAGIVLKNTLGAMAVILPVYLGLIVVLSTSVRPHYQQPETITIPIASAVDGVDLVPAGGWRLSGGFLDQQGHPVAFEVTSCRTGDGALSRDDVTTCQQDRGITQLTASFHPDGRFWTFQFYEAGTVSVLCVLLLGLSAYALRRR